MGTTAEHQCCVLEPRVLGERRALIIGESEGLVKMVAERGGPILGVHVVGPLATKVMVEGYRAVSWEAKPEEGSLLVHSPASDVERDAR